MYIKSTSGTEVFKNEYQIHDSINGIPTIEMDHTQLELNHAEPIYFLSKNWNDRFAMILKEEESIGDSSRVKFTGVHSFVYDFKASRIYDTYTQYFNLQNILNVVFEDTGYNFEISGDDSYYSEHFQNFGNKDKMSLFNQILDRWGLEYRVSGTTVYISNARGEDTPRQFRYKMNIENSKVNLDVSTGATYIRGFFGRKPEEHDEDQTDTSFEREMTHDLADVYGIRHAEPYSNQNITTVETADAYLKQRLEDTWKLSIEIDVIDLGADETVSVGDVVWAIDERLNLKFKTRIVELVSYYNVDDEIYKQVAILGNQTMISDMFANEVTAQDLVEEVEQSVNKQIEDSQAEFDNNFNQLRDEIAANGQSVLDEAIANIEAKDEAMRDEFSVWSEDLEDLRSDYIASIEDMTGTIDGIGTNITNINDRVDNVFADVSEIQEFIGDTSQNLNTKLQNISIDFNERIRNVDSNTYNMLRESRFDNLDFVATNGGTIGNDESIPYYRNTNFSVMAPWVSPLEMVTLESGKEYILSFDFKSESVPEADYVWFNAFDGGGDRNIILDSIENTLYNLPTDGVWRRVYIRFTGRRDMTGRIRIGSRFSVDDTNVGEFRIRLPYLTSSSNKEWVYHPLDATQSIEEVTRRITELEDGREELITRTEYDFDTGVLDGTIREIRETVDESSSTIANHEEWFVTNGSNVLQTVDEVSSKVWTTDIASIQPNLIPQSANAWVDGRYWSGGSLTAGGQHANSISLERSLAMQTGSQVSVTLSDESSESSGISHWLVFFTNSNGTIFSGENAITVSRGQTRTFTVPEGSTRVLVSAISDGTNINPSWIEQPNRRINVKLEIGSNATPMMGFMSNVEQLANRVAITVQDIDSGGVIRQSDVSIQPTGVTIGSAYLGENQLASMFRVMPNAIEAISDNINFRGNLNVFGQISGISVDAVTSSFGSVYADFIEGLYTKTEYLEAFDAEVKRAFIKEAAIEELFAHSATIRELEAIDLTANQIRIAFNDISPNVNIDNQSLEFHDGANRVARMDRFGSRFYHTGREVGQIGPSRIVNSNHRGLRFFLGQDAEYMAWTTSTGEGLSDVKLMWAKGDSDYKEGFTFYDRVRLRELIPLNSTHDAESLNLLSTNAFSPGRSTMLGIDNVDADSIPTGNIRGGSQVIFKPGTTHVRASAYSRIAFLELISNSTRNVLTSNAPYDFTTTSASNYLTIDDQWQFRRLTSSKKYKYHNKFIDTVTASKLLEINPATWFDKTAVDDYTSELNDNYDGLDKDEIEQKQYVKEKIKPIPGLYAEDVRDAGLEDFVTYNEDGEVDGINQNLWVLLIPLVKELKSEIKELKEQLQ